MIEIKDQPDTPRAWSGITIDLDGRSLDLSWRWLRDHSRDDASFHHGAQQRLVSPGVVAAAGPGTAVVDRGSELIVTWPDGTTARYGADQLTALAPAAEMHSGARSTTTSWRGHDITERLVTLDFDALVAGEAAHDERAGDFSTTSGLHRALDALATTGLVTVQNVPTDQATTRRVLERFGYIRRTIFGDMWDFSADESATDVFDDTASTPLEILPHTDGTYSYDAPGLLGLHCHAYDATGGENVFVDGRALSERIAVESPRHHELLRTIDVPGQYIGDGAHLVAVRPVLRHRGEQFVQISYNHHDRAPFLLPEPLMTEVFDALAHVDAVANDPAMQFEHAMRPGDMVIFDNWRLLHGRRAFVGRRHIAGGYVNHEDLASTARQQAATTPFA